MRFRTLLSLGLFLHLLLGQVSALPVNLVTPALVYRRWAILTDAALRADGMADLLTAALSQAGFELVERDALMAVTTEQQLQAVGAQDAAHRVQLGRLLRADALILISAEIVGGKKVVKFVISDTEHGARLAFWSLPAESQLKTVEAMTKAVSDTRTRFGEGIKWIVAVPRFLSKDLTHEFDHFQAEFSAITENGLLSLPGVAVLEIEEAQSIRKELDIDAKNVHALVPLFVEGTYEVSRSMSSSQPGGAVPVGVSLKVDVGNGRQILRSLNRTSLTPKEVGKVLSSQLPAMALSLNVAAMPAIETGRQVELLVARADVFASLGSFEHSINSREAALLLSPNAVHQRDSLVREAYQWCDNVSTRLKLEGERVKQVHNVPWQEGVKDWSGLDPAYANELEESRKQFYSLWSRCIDHLEYLIRRREISFRDAGGLWRCVYLMGRQSMQFRSSSVEQNILQQQTYLDDRLRTFIRELGPRIVELVESPSPGVGQSKEELVGSRKVLWNLSALEALISMHGPSRLDFPLIAETLQTFPAEDPPTFSLIRLVSDVSALPTPDLLLHPTIAQDYPGFVDLLLRSDKKGLKLLARFGQVWMQDMIEQQQSPRQELKDKITSLMAELFQVGNGNGRWQYAGQEMERVSVRAHLSEQRGFNTVDARDNVRPKLKPVAQQAISPVSFDRIEVMVKMPEGASLPLTAWDATRKYEDPASRFHLIACGPGLDVAWHCKAVFLHRKPGVLEPILVDPAEHVRDVAWDGVHVWLASGLQGICVIDTAGKIVARVTTEQGLPPADQAVFIRALEPGKVFVTGSFGVERRGWCAMLELDEHLGNIRVNVFHKAMTPLEIPGKSGLSPEQYRSLQEKSADPGLVFVPDWAEVAPPGVDAPAGVVWIGRQFIYLTAAYRPHALRVDLATLKVRAVPTQGLLPNAEVVPLLFLDTDRAISAMAPQMFEFSFVGPLPNGRKSRFVFDPYPPNNSNKFSLLKMDGNTYLAGADWFHFNLKTLSAERLGAGLSTTDGRGPAIPAYLVSSVLGPMAYETLGDVVFFPISLDPAHPRLQHGVVTAGSGSTPSSRSGQSTSYANGQIKVVGEQSYEFRSGKGQLFVAGIKPGESRFSGSEGDAYRLPEEEVLLYLVRRTLKYPEEIERVKLSPAQVLQLGNLMPDASKLLDSRPATHSQTPPLALALRRKIIDVEKFRRLHRAYVQAEGQEKLQALEPLFAAIREMGTEQLLLAERTIFEIKAILTPAQLRSMRFDAR